MNREVRTAMKAALATASAVDGAVVVVVVAAVAVVVMGAASIAGCGPSEPSVINPRLSPNQAPGPLSPRLRAKATDFHGTCKWGRAPGPPENYPLQLRARANASGAILVYADAVFIPGDYENVLGELPSGSEVAGVGPVAMSGEYGRGYAILVRGHTGRVCRGYVSVESVEIAAAAR